MAVVIGLRVVTQAKVGYLHLQAVPNLKMRIGKVTKKWIGYGTCTCINFIYGKASGTNLNTIFPLL